MQLQDSVLLQDRYIDLRKEDMVLMIYSLDALVMYSRSVVRGGSTYVYEDTESILY